MLVPPQQPRNPMRRPRLELPGIPLHITHRGVNRAATFLDEDDYVSYLQALEASAEAQHVRVHGYVLMTNHVHLLVSAQETGTVSRMMQAIGRRYVRTLNTKHRRTGTLWEGRYKSCLVDSDHYLLRCLRYIELNPVRAGMVALPEHYRWSSVHAHLGKHPDPRWTPHPLYLALNEDPVARSHLYHTLLMEPISSADIQSIRDHLQQERVLGSPAFQAMVEKTLNRSCCLRSPGRPTKETENSNTNVL
ncbi:transposase [Pseudoxanthomonas sacheonensis]|uniref:Transposase n=1 Tax=Pseudoxanthomonas sacheonensis TaxID=443615 RepID=A0ABU1RNG7_9GAMM|nr:transposase [Pseudoxanthomonas sacheonensis]MDR6840311.1 putative transposase [Pseudoxanthomonas sacheonensis]